MNHEWMYAATSQTIINYPPYKEVEIPPLVSKGADPFIFIYNNKYHLVQSGSPDTHINLRNSSLFSALDNAPETTICVPTNPEFNQMIWAPEIHQIDNNWYLYAAASDGCNKNHRNYVWRSTEPDPMTPSYEFAGKLTNPNSDFWGIDLTVLNYKDNLYAIWSGWEDLPENVPDWYHFNDHDLPQHLYISLMSDPTTLYGERVKISSPTNDWEHSVAPINEGPQAVVQGTSVDLLYSANASWTSQYCMGKLTLRGTDPLDPDAWYKHPAPILCGQEGPGHGMVFSDPIYGTLLTYHKKKNAEPGWDRNIWFTKY